MHVFTSLNVDGEYLLQGSRAARSFREVGSIDSCLVIILVVSGGVFSTSDHESSCFAVNNLRETFWQNLWNVFQFERLGAFVGELSLSQNSLRYSVILSTAGFL